jgi:hypothetical protein
MRFFVAVVCTRVTKPYLAGDRANEPTIAGTRSAVEWVAKS